MADNTSKFIAGLIFGGLAGVAAAMLYAPQSGDETREMLRSSAMDAQARTRETVQRAQEQVNQKVGEVQQRVGSMAGDVQHKVGTIAEDARRKATQLKDVGIETAKDASRTVKAGVNEAEDVVNS